MKIIKTITLLAVAAYLAFTGVNLYATNRQVEACEKDVALYGGTCQREGAEIVRIPPTLGLPNCGCE